MDFSFNFELRYSAEVEELLYAVETFGLELPGHSVQAKHGRTVCLLCGSDLLVNETSLKSHFSCEQHRQKSSKEAFDAYHRTFLELPEPQQISQKDFMPKTADHVYCEVCNRKVLLKNVANHTHKTPLNNVSFDYSQLTPKDIKPHVLEDYLYSEHPLIYHHVGRALICLVCASVAEETFKEHLDRTEFHKDSLSRLTALRDFHWKWLQEDEEFHKLRRWTLLKKKKLGCVFCNRNYCIANMIKHLQDLPCCFLPDDHILRTDEIAWKDEKEKFIADHLRFQMTYIDEVSQTFYPKQITDYLLNFQDFPIYTIQRQLDKTKCLICNEILLDTFLYEDILRHVETEKHETNLQNKENLLLLESYHKFWMVQEPQIQIKQFNFMSSTNIPLHFQTCLVCNKPVKEKDIVKHIAIDCTNIQKEAKQAKPLVSQQVLTNGGLSSSFAEADMKNGVVVAGTSGENSPGVKKGTGKEVNVGISEVGSPIPGGSENSSPKTVNDLKVKDLVNGLNALNILESENLEENIPTLIKLWDKAYFCVCCGIFICGKPNPHLRGLQHKKKVQMPPNHKDYEAIQMHMKIINNTPNFKEHFEVRTLDNVMCKNCLTTILFKSVHKHFNKCIGQGTDTHVTTTRIIPNGMPTPPSTSKASHLSLSKSVENLNTKHSFNIQFPGATIKPTNSLISLNHINSVKSPKKTKSPETLNLSLSLDFHNLNIPKTSKPSTSSSSSSTNLYKASPNKMYSRAVLADLYSSNVSKKAVPLHSLFIQKRSSFEKFCLYCSKPIGGPQNIHTEGRKHQNNFQNKEKQQVITCYHLHWLDQTEQRQYDQMKFNPWSVESMVCKFCREIIVFKKLHSHCCEMEDLTLKAKVPDMYSKVEVRYCQLVQEKFYSKSMMDVISYVLKTKLPVCRHWQGRIICLLCGKKILRDLTLLSNHLITLHSSNDPKLWNQLEVLVKYHKFWELQTSEDQILQVHFLLNCLDTVKCTKGHIVPYKEIFDHVDTCHFQDSDKLVEVFKKILIPKEESSETLSCTLSQSNLDLLDFCKFPHGSSLASESLLSFSENENEAVELAKENKKKVKRRNRVKKDKDNKGKENLLEDMGENNEKKHNIVPSVKYPNSQNLLDLLPNRMEVHSKYLMVHQDCVACSACNETISKSAEDLINHVVSEHHMAITRIQIPGYSYQCDICPFKCKKEILWQRHLDSAQHNKIYADIGVVRKTMINEFECPPCRLVMYGDKISIIRHEGKFDEDRNFNKKKGINLLPSVKKMFKSEMDCNRELKRLMEETVKDNTAMEMCVKAVETSLRKIYPECIGYPFGSRVTGLSTKYSDLDLFVDIGSTYTGSGALKQEIFRKAKKVFLADSKNFSSVRPIDSARTPIIKLVHIMSDIDCDVSFVSGLSVENSKYINFCLDLQPAARPAMILLKTWSNRLKNESITSYCLCMMFIFQLQLQGLAIPVHKLRELTTKDVVTIDGWHTITYNKPMEVLKKHVTIYKKEPFYLVREFFRIYSTFSFSSDVVCPLLGRTILVSKFLVDEKNGSGLPDEMITYKNYLGVDPENQFRAVADMFVQDPFDLSHNLTKCVKKVDVKRFKEFCKLTYDIMKS